MKKNTQLRRNTAFQYSSLAIATCAMALSLNSCQDYEYGFTESEVHQVAIERQYIKEFHKAFPEVDPLHTWMCEPDTIRINKPTAVTRATSQPIVSGPDLENTLNYTWEDVKDIVMGYMKEEQDNRGKCAQSFEYVAFEDKTYDIYPVFWGRKFCKNNEIGVYWVDDSGHEHILDPFWSDKDNKIKVKFSDGHTTTMPNSANPIIYDPNGNYDTTDHYKDNNKKATDYAFPHYTITVSAGTKWGLYLRTDKTQDPTIYTCKKCGSEYHSQPRNWQHQTHNDTYWGYCTTCNNWYSEFSFSAERITWHSNANYNPDKTKAGATFHYDGKTYCAFEDAPHECTGGQTGTCSKCGYGHYDHDFNDIVLYISPRPYETTYQSIQYRVMCEDLGGSFDWDFNDVVYDVVYTEDQTGKNNATVSIVLQAVGGTLPVQIFYGNDLCHVNNVSELHEILNNQKPNDLGLYEPVNVGENNHKLGNKTIYTIKLDEKRVLNMDVRDYVKNISIRVKQDPDGNDVTTTVKFPEAPKNNSDVVPQCFMTSTQTDWADELQPINEKYSHFEGWVKQHQENTGWWTEGLGGTEQNVVTK